MKDLLSVIIPVYNVKSYLAICLDSILQQTYPHLEIICVDDGSTDGSDIILDQYAGQDARIKVIHQQNGGMSAARNAGIKIATGQYITFVDSDDYINPETYSLCIPLFLMDIDVVIFAAQLIDGKKYLNKNDDDYFEVHHQNKVQITPEVLSHENVMAWNKIYKSDIIKSNNILFFDGLWYEDVGFFWQYMSFVQHAYFLRNQLYHYRRHPGTIMFSTFLGNDRAIDRLIIYSKLLSFWQTNKRFKPFIDEVGAVLFEKAFYFAYTHSSMLAKKSVIKLAREIISNYQLDHLFPSNQLIQDFVCDKLWRYPWIDEYCFRQYLYSVKKFHYDKVICILGRKFRFKRKKYQDRKHLL
ncbi:glycosyltransferase [Neisseriaceae bacterium ESL0693]|nr:glycosyltransferase [Neisseriaceae bacterium ESL0693]